MIVALYLHEWMRRLLNDPKSTRRVAFVGCTEVSLMLADRITRNSRSLGMTVHGFFDDRSPDRLGHCGSMRRLGTMSEIVSAVQRNQLDAIFVALPIRQVPRVMELVQELRNTTVSIYYLPDICALDLIQARTGELLGMPVVSMCETPFYGYGGLVKRMTDVAFARGNPRVRGAADGADRAGREAHVARAGALQAAPLRARWTRDPGLQVPHHDRAGRRRPGASGHAHGFARDARRPLPASLFAGRAAAAVQRAARER